VSSLNVKERMPLSCKTNSFAHDKADLATEQESQLKTVCANQTTGLTNGRVGKWAPEVVLSPFCVLSHHQLMFPFCLLNQPATSIM